ncbi:MAG TPA: hypothetical protein VHV10_08730, partial [Ktedonobacteraceae bacterium]|nr:hypothetical protein [Ktedonobacteraceae bacterium]
PYLTAHVLDTLTRLPATLNDKIAKEQILATLAQQHIPNLKKTTASPPLLAPCSSLLRIADSDLLQQMLSPEAVRARGIFDPQAVKTLMQPTNEKAVPRKLLLVFTTQLLCQLFDVEI